jgi:HlyD family secretion protein
MREKCYNLEIKYKFMQMLFEKVKKATLYIKENYRSYITKRNASYVLAIMVVGFIFAPNAEETRIETVKAEVADLVDEVSVTGSVKPIKEADLAFEVSGKVNAVKVVENQFVDAGAVLFELDRNNFFAQAQTSRAQVEIEQARVMQYEAQVTSEKARLADLKTGAKPAEISLKETQVTNLEMKLENAELDYQIAKETAESDLQLAYINLQSGVQEAFNTAYNSLLELTDMQLESFYNSSMETFGLEINKAKAAEVLIGANNAGKWSSRAISQSNGGVKQTLSKVTTIKNNSTLDSLAQDVITGLNYLLNAYNSLELDSAEFNKHSATISTQKTAINSSVKSLTTLQNAIVAQVNNNKSSVLTKEIALNNAANNLSEGNSNLNLSRSSASVKAIEAQESVVNQSRASLKAQKASLKAAQGRLNEVYAELNKRVLRAPYSGVVTNIDVELGEIALSNNIVAKLLGEGAYEIKADIPETDLSKVKIGNKAILDLDAYSNEVLNATVTNINEAAELVDGVPVYEITLRFDKDYDFVKSGMTANIDILVDESDGVISVPIRAVEDGKIRILLENGIVELRSVETGLRSSDGLLEILSGVNPGEEVVIFMEDDKK